MQETWSIDLIWWITAVELPVIACLFWLTWRNRRDTDSDIDDLRHECEQGYAFVREGLAAHKLEVAQSYVSVAYLKEVERRLTDHLIRIENKLDGVVMAGPGGTS